MSKNWEKEAIQDLKKYLSKEIKKLNKRVDAIEKLLKEAQIL